MMGIVSIFQLSIGIPIMGCLYLLLPIVYIYIWLVVSNIFYFPFHIWDVILPIDSYFSRWLSHHQPDRQIDMYIYIDL